MAEGRSLNSKISDRRLSSNSPNESHGREDWPIKMLKMKVDPAMYMKTNHKDKLSCVNKAKRERFGHESCSIYDASQRELRVECVFCAFFVHNSFRFSS